MNANPQSKVYGSVDPAFTYIIAPALAYSDTFSGTLARDPGEDVNTYAIVQGALTPGLNYSVTYVGANLTITKATLIATADDQTIGAGAFDPIFTVTYD